MYEELNSLLTMIIEKQRNATLLFFKLENIILLTFDTENRIKSMFILGVVHNAMDKREVYKIAHVYK